MNSRIELLSPAGDSDAFKAAVLAGADAIYFGLEKFSARTRAANISLKELEILAPIAKSRSKRLYLTLNTLLRDSEINDAINLTAMALERGVDAIIVQDIGLLTSIRTHFPHAEIHASTQMTTHNLSQIEFLAESGVSQVNLSRELSIDQIRLFSEKLKHYGIIPEVFVHGAYCISYSGQCYLSGSLYGQAGNRGSCVQPCRRQFSTSSGNFTAPFSLKDNSAFKYAEELCSCAPISLKIEGRIKNAEYVWSVTKSWREELDLIKAGKASSKESDLLNKSFNRGFATDYLEGCPTQNFFNFGQKDATLQKAGTVQSFSADKKVLKISRGSSDAVIETNDRLLIKTRNDKFICNAEISRLFNDSKPNFSNAEIKITGKLNGKIEKGQIVYKTSPIFEAKNLKAEIDALKPLGIPLSVKIAGKYNEALECTFFTGNVSVQVKTKALLEKAEKHGLNEETLRQKLGRLDNTGFSLKEIDITSLEKNLFIAPQELNELRRDAIQKLNRKTGLFELPSDIKADSQKNVGRDNTNCTNETSGEASFIQPYLIDIEEKSSISQNMVINKEPELSFLCSSIRQASSLLKDGKTVILELSLLINDETQDFLIKNRQVIPYFQSILFDEDLKNAEALLEKLAAKKDNDKRLILCENTGLAFFAHKIGMETILGSFCNASNSRSIHAYSDFLGIRGIIPSSEISYEDVNKLKIPENVRMYYPLFSEELLMQSRQCLLHNLTGCKKTSCDRICIEECERNFQSYGKAGESFRAIKRKGFYSSLFSQKAVSNAKAFRLLRNTIDTWIVDIRFQDSETENLLIKKAEDFIHKTNKQTFLEPFENTMEKKFYFC